LPGERFHHLVLTDDASANQAAFDKLLSSESGGTVRLPAGTFVLDRGVTVGPDWTLAGAPHEDGPVATWLTSSASDGQPIVHVLGSHVAIEDIGFLPPPCSPGEHGGDLGTAITVGRYLYPVEAEWIESIRIRRVQVQRRDARAANCIAVVGAVCDIDISQASIVGGCTGVAVHWGAVGDGVDSITGPSYHPHRVAISGLCVSDAFEGFYLSSVHDVDVSDVCLSDVEIGFRLLPGDNTDRFHPSSRNSVGERIRVSRACVSWNGPLYAVRVAGWGRSEIDHSIRVLEYRDVVIEDCTLVALPLLASARNNGRLRARSPIVMEQASGVLLDNIRVDARGDQQNGFRMSTACCSVRTTSPPGPRRPWSGTPQATR
jgi:hypothetical protein